MDAFLTHQQIVDSYKDYLKSYISIRDWKLKEEVEIVIFDKSFIPEPLIQFNLDFARATSFDHLIANNSSIQNFYQQVDGSKSDLRYELHRFESGTNTKFYVTIGICVIVVFLEVVRFFLHKILNIHHAYHQN